MTLPSEIKAKMVAAIEHFKTEIKSLRTGRANPGMLDNVHVNVYGTDMRLKDIAQVTTPEARQLLISPFDPKNVPSICKAIEIANLGFMPNPDGSIIRIMIPQMDATLRAKMVKQLHDSREKSKVIIRNIRRDGNELVRKMKTAGTIPEDILKKFEKEIQELTDKFCKEVDTISLAKEKEVTTI